MAFGLLQGILNIGRQKKANKALDQVLAQDVKYQKSPYAGQQLGIANQLFNGRMAGAPQLERNIQTNQGTQLSNLQRGATDSSQLLSLGSQAQGQTNNAFGDLQIQEAQNKQRMLQNLNQAYGTNIAEGDKEFDDQVRRYGNLVNVRGMQEQNKTNALNGVFNGLNSDINQAAQIAGMFFNPMGAVGGMGAGGGQMTPTGTYGYQGQMPQGIGNRRTPNFR